MRFTSFVPAVMALSLFSATTQALPTLSQEPVALLKRGGNGPGLIDAVVKAFVDVRAKVLLDACVDLDVDVCAAVDVKLKAKANVLELIKADIDINKLQVDVKAKVDADIKAKVKLDVKAKVIANIDAHVRAVVLGICPDVNSACLHKHAHAIVAKVDAKILVDIKALVVKIRAELEAFVKLRVKIHIDELNVNVLGLIKANVKAFIKVNADIKVKLDAFVKLCVDLFAKVKLNAIIGAL
ncbi:hypothetical protein BGZ72_011094 [Mortierella alpina]|nr:hypothetical protein BGZ72_011094 [Mortierella alpina]